jgi:hypothetical protein
MMFPRHWYITALLTCGLALASSHSRACILPANNLTAFFDDIPENVDEPVIAKITVIGLLESVLGDRLDFGGNRRSFNGFAYVHHVFKGQIDTDIIKISAPPSSCDYPFRVGASSGIVMGRPRLFENGMMELKLISLPIIWLRQNGKLKMR